MSKKTLVLGASLNENRYSNLVIHRLLNNRQEVVAFGLKPGKVAEVYVDTELVFYKEIDTVTIYINPRRQKAYYDYILALKPKRVLFNPGTENIEFYTLLEENDITYESACTLVLLSTNQY